MTAEDSLAQLAMWRLAAAITERTISAERAEQVSMLSAGELLNQLLDQAVEDSGPLVRRASDVGITVTAWHEAVEMKFENLLALVGDDTVAAYQSTQVLAQVAAQTARHRGQLGRGSAGGRGAPAADPGTTQRLAGIRKLRSTVDEAVEAAREALPGIRSSAESEAAARGCKGCTPHRRKRFPPCRPPGCGSAFNEPVMFDAPGLSRLLVEWYSSSSVRQGIEDLLAPLGQLGSAKQKEYLTTLRVYLENNKSHGPDSQADVPAPQHHRLPD